MKIIFLFSFTFVFSLNLAQTKAVRKKSIKNSAAKPTVGMDLQKINDSIPALIPFKKDGKFGFRNQKGKIIVSPQFSNVGFFTEDCHLQNSNNQKVIKFGSSEFASVRTPDGKDYRIDHSGKKVYEYRDADMGQCSLQFRQQAYHGYARNGFYGVIKDEHFKDEKNFRDYQIYPQYQYLHILESKNLEKPMIIAAQGNRFGIIDINNKVVIPFEYADIKPNFSWYLANLFEVSKDGSNYYFIDVKNKAY